MIIANADSITLLRTEAIGKEASKKKQYTHSLAML
jgi:hypothetical protein